jgi:hypothetical protein
MAEFQMESSTTPEISNDKVKGTNFLSYIVYKNSYLILYLSMCAHS